MKKRLISAFIALLICIPLVIKGGFLFYTLAILLSLIGLREFINLFIKDDFTKFVTYIVFLSIIATNLFKTNFDNLLSSNIIGIILLMFSILMLYNYKKKDLDISKCFYLFGVTLFLGISFSIVIINRNIGLLNFLYLLIIPFMNDTFAHLIGSIIGKHKINTISPNKSWEGCIAGLVFGTLISSLFYLYFINVKVDLLMLIVVNMFLSVVGQLGDLFFSLIKRNYKIKDFSNLMPGHGGVLDRLDSVIFVMLASTFILTFL